MLAAEFDLVGLFGVDFIDDGEQLWPIEINPRYTASVEILERACRFSAVAWHVAACREQIISAGELSPGHAWHAKRILYTDKDLFIQPEFTATALGSPPTAQTPRWPIFPPLAAGSQPASQ